jgi:hypothetical protein
MKLVKINDIREGQIWKGLEGLYLVDEKYRTPEDGEGLVCEIGYILDRQNGIMPSIGDISEEDFINIYADKLIGFLGITHWKRDDRSLGHSPRTGYQLNDVVRCGDSPGCYRLGVICNIDKEIIKIFLDTTNVIYINAKENSIRGEGEKEWTKFNKKEKPVIVGILGVNYEFVNDKSLIK